MSNKSNKSNQVPATNSQQQGKPTGATSQSKSSNNSVRSKKQKRNVKKKNSQSKNNQTGQAAANVNQVAAASQNVEASVDQGNSPQNHISWYNAIPSVYQAAFSAATMPALGWNVNYGAYSKTIKYEKDYDSIPGVMSIEFAPTIGRANSGLDPINKVAEAIWKKFRTGITSNGWYEPADLMMYFMAADSIYMMWNHLKRVYGVAQWYDARNRYLPDALIRAMGFNPHDDFLTMHLPSLRLALNKLAAKMATFHVPADMTIMSRHSWLTSNIFYDDDPSVTDMSQMYVFRPTYAYVAALGKLTSVPLGYSDTTMSVTETVSMIENMINMMGQHLDAIKFSAEVDRVYQGKICTLGEVKEDYELGCTYNPDVLTQIRNMTMAVDVAPGDIEQRVENPDTADARSIIIQTISYESSDHPRIPLLSGTIALNFLKAQPSNDDVCYATRLRFSVDRDSDDNWIFTYGSEIVTNAYVWFYSETETGYRLKCRNVDHLAVVNYTDIVSLQGMVVNLHFSSVFNNFPVVEILDNSGEYTTASDFEPGDVWANRQFGNRHNIALLTHAQLATMHEAALMSEFNYPSN